MALEAIAAAVRLLSVALLLMGANMDFALADCAFVALLLNFGTTLLLSLESFAFAASTLHRLVPAGLRVLVDYLSGGGGGGGGAYIISQD